MINKEDVLLLVRSVKNGDEEAFRELEGVSKPLLISLSNTYASYHHKFEYDDFYSIGLHALHNACMSFKDGNPAFLSYAKVIIVRSLLSEIEYWNQGKRNIFNNKEVTFDDIEEISSQEDLSEFAINNDFREKLKIIIDDSFKADKSKILIKYYIENQRISEIANESQLNYKYVHKVIERGTEKIQIEYKKRYIP